MGEDAGRLSESARNEADDGKDGEINAQSEQSLIPDNLKGFEVVLVEQLLLEDKEEPVEEQRSDDENIANNLKTLNSVNLYRIGASGTASREDHI